MSWETVDEAFKELDKREYVFFARALGSYRRSLIEEGFTRREAMKLVESYARFIYDMSIEEYLNMKRKERDAEDDDDDDDSLD